MVTVSTWTLRKPGLFVLLTYVTLADVESEF